MPYVNAFVFGRERRWFVPDNKGRVHSREQIERHRAIMIGRLPPNYKDTDSSCSTCGKIFHRKQSHQNNRINNFCSRDCYHAFMKKDPSLLSRLREYSNKIDMGKTEGRERFKQTASYKIWRTAVFSRDNFTCQACGKRGGVLHAHHLLPYSRFPHKRLDISNGQTLCASCHRKTDSYGVNKTEAI